MKKMVYIVHRWGGTPDDDWYTWLKQQLESRGYAVKLHQMPGTNNPKIDSWVLRLMQLVEAGPDIENYFIGHSIGCQTILRYLDRESRDLNIRKLVLVAGWLKLSGLESDEEKNIAKPWLDTPIDYQKVLSHKGEIEAIFSDDDPFVPPDNHHLFKEKLNANITILPNRGHFETTQLPEILKLFND